jgi:hypothetical protein
MVHLIDPIGGGLRQSIQERCGYDHVLAGPGKGWTWHTFMVDGGDDGSSPSSDFGEGDGGGSLHSQRGLASVSFGQLGIEACLLSCKLILALGRPPLSVDLSGADPRLLLLLVSLLSNVEELHSWLGCCGPHHDRGDGL